MQFSASAVHVSDDARKRSPCVAAEYQSPAPSRRATRGPKRPRDAAKSTARGRRRRRALLPHALVPLAGRNRDPRLWDAPRGRNPRPARERRRAAHGDGALAQRRWPPTFTRRPPRTRARAHRGGAAALGAVHLNIDKNRHWAAHLSPEPDRKYADVEIPGAELVSTFKRLAAFVDGDPDDVAEVEASSGVSVYDLPVQRRICEHPMYDSQRGRHKSALAGAERRVDPAAPLLRPAAARAPTLPHARPDGGRQRLPGRRRRRAGAVELRGVGGERRARGAVAHWPGRVRRRVAGAVLGEGARRAAPPRDSARGRAAPRRGGRRPRGGRLPRGHLGLFAGDAQPRGGFGGGGGRGGGGGGGWRRAAEPARSAAAGAGVRHAAGGRRRRQAVCSPTRSPGSRCPAHRARAGNGHDGRGGAVPLCGRPRGGQVDAPAVRHARRARHLRRGLLQRDARRHARRGAFRADPPTPTPTTWSYDAPVGAHDGSPGGHVVIDDWHLPGVRAAVHDFRAARYATGAAPLLPVPVDYATAARRSGHAA